MKALLLCFIVLMSADAFAASATYNTRHTDKAITFRLAYGFATSFFFVSPLLRFQNEQEANGITVPETLKMEPNVQFYQGFGVSYKWIGLTYKYSIPKEDESIIQKGKTKVDDLTLTFHSTHFSAILFKQTFSGMFQTLPEDDTTTNADGLEISPQFPDMELDKIGADLIFKLSPESLSIGALYDQSNIQTKPGGSWLVRLTGNRFSITNGGAPIIPTNYSTAFGEDSSVTSISAEGYSIGGGYGYTYVAAKRFYIGGAMTYGMSISQGEYVLADGTVKAIDGTTFSSIYALLSLGMNMRSFFTGAMYAVDSVNVTLDDFAIGTPKNFAEFYIGARF